MEKNSIEKCINRLQDEEKQFLSKYTLKLNDILIRPTEIEVYYHKINNFEDNSVHQNELQRNNFNHFYIHRWGKAKTDAYKGGNYPGLDFVVSGDKDTYYSYLIRSAVISNSLKVDSNKVIVGPNKVLKAIKEATDFSFKDIENTLVEMVPNDIPCDVLFSTRVGLGQKVEQEYKSSELRAVLCDDCWFRITKYPAKETMIINFLSKKILLQEITKEEALKYAKEKLGYVPKKIKEL